MRYNTASGTRVAVALSQMAPASSPVRCSSALYGGTVRTQRTTSASSSEAADGSAQPQGWTSRTDCMETLAL